jgi:hypothetical protein
MVAPQDKEAAAEQAVVAVLLLWLERIQPHSWLWQQVAVVVAEQAMVQLVWQTRALVTLLHSQPAQAKTKLAMVAAEAEVVVVYKAA